MPSHLPNALSIYSVLILFVMNTNANDDIMQKDIKEPYIQHADEEESRRPKARQ
jgi:hypothetical protein